MLYRLPQTRAGWLELLTVRNAAFLIAGVSFASLAAAWTFQYLGFEPCELCYKERIPYYFAVVRRAACGLARELGAEGSRADPGRDLRRDGLRCRP